MLIARPGTIAATQCAMPTMTARYFAKKKRSRKNPDVPTEDEVEEEVAAAAEPEPVV